MTQILIIRPVTFETLDDTSGVVPLDPVPLTPSQKASLMSEMKMFAQQAPNESVEYHGSVLEGTIIEVDAINFDSTKLTVVFHVTSPTTTDQIVEKVVIETVLQKLFDAWFVDNGGPDWQFNINETSWFWLGYHQ